MKALELGQLAGLIKILQELQTTCFETAGLPNRKFDEESRKILVSTFESARDYCEAVGWLETRYQISFMVTHNSIFKNKIDWSSASADLRNALNLILLEANVRKFVQVGNAFIHCVNNEALFGQVVQRAFPSAASDIMEAGNCISVGCGTAAVFHLMRAVEWSLRALCRHLGFRNIPSTRKPGKKKKYIAIEYNQWERMLEEANDKVDKRINMMRPGKKKQEMQQFYYPLLREYKGFKDAWRNHCMHARDEFSIESANAILEHVKAFMASLGSKVSE